jgi:flagellar protein FliL
MAEENEDKNEDQGAEGKKKAGFLAANKKLVIGIVVGVLLLLCSVGGTLFMLGFFDGSESDEQEVEEVSEEPEVAKPASAMYFPIKPAFVVNFPTQGRQRMLQADITVMTRDMEVFTALQTHLPLIKNRLVMLLGGEVYEDLQTDEGKELLRQKALQALQDIVQQEIGKSDVEQVLFTNFVMQ